MEPWMIQLIWAVVGISSFIIGGKVIFNSAYFKEKAKTKTVAARKSGKAQGLLETMQEVLDNPQAKLDKIDEEMNALRSKGVTEDQMGHLSMERKFVEMANSTLGQALGPTVVDIVKQGAAKVGFKLR